MSNGNSDYLYEYRALMHDVKRRHHVAACMYVDPSTLSFRTVALDSIYLQIRKIIEIVAFSSLVLNVDIAREIAEAKHYHADKVLNSIERRHGPVFPRPVRQVMNPEPGIRAHFDPVTQGALRRDEIAMLYGICGDVLHARNPLRRKQEFGSQWAAIPVWLEKIRTLLNAHLATIVGDQNLYLVQMNGDVHRMPTMTVFSPATAPAEGRR